MISDFRFELSFKNLEQLKDKLEFCLDNNIKKINIPCKGSIKKDFLLEVVEFIGKNYCELDIIYHYSLFHQYSKNKEVSYKDLVNFTKKCSKYENEEILLISGSKKKKNFEVVNVLHQIKNNNILKIGIAYNPYFPTGFDIEKERNNFIKKMESGVVNSIWLQFGSNINLLENEINFLNEVILNHKLKSKNIRIYGSLFIPSRLFLARFKFRPWRGVFLDDKYLNSLDYSKKVTKNIMNLYLRNNINPLIESECSSSKQLNDLLNL
tara:strand:+ start:2441 stop:3238 length:798 start_codon:yes stop_codon:yes gene_type:complete